MNEQSPHTFYLFMVDTLWPNDSSSGSHDFLTMMYLLCPGNIRGNKPFSPLIYFFQGLKLFNYINIHCMW